MGHRSIAITGDAYGHVAADMQADVASAAAAAAARQAGCPSCALSFTRPPRLAGNNIRSAAKGPTAYGKVVRRKVYAKTSGLTARPLKGLVR